MVKVVFVGDEPSKQNLDNNIPFVGAKCFSTLVKWIAVLQPNYYLCYNSNTFSALEHIHSLHNGGFKVIALGNKASERLKARQIEHFKLPHPSGLNRQLNDEKMVESQLQACYEYITDFVAVSGAV